MLLRDELQIGNYSSITGEYYKKPVPSRMIKLDYFKATEDCRKERKKIPTAFTKLNNH